MTLEELQSEVESLKGHNAKLLGELKAAKAKAKGADIDPDEYAKLQDEADELRTKLAQAEKTSQSAIKKLNDSLSEKEGALQNLLIDGGLSDALAKAGVRPEFMDAAKALLKQQAKVDSASGQYQAVISGKPLSDAITEWAAQDGKHFVAATQNSGGGANPGGQNFSGKSFKDMTGAEKIALYRQDPKAYEAAASQA